MHSPRSCKAKHDQSKTKQGPQIILHLETWSETQNHKTKSVIATSCYKMRIMRSKTEEAKGIFVLLGYSIY